MSSSSSIEKQDAHWIEWGVGFISAALVLLMIGVIFWEAITDKHMPPDLTAVITSRKHTDAGYRVSFDITNSSTTTAAGVVVRGEILEHNQVSEAVDVSFDYVPAESKSSGAIVFSQYPGDRNVRIRPMSFTDP